MEKLNLVLGISNTACSLLVAGFAVPLIREKVKMNPVYGIRFAKAFESEEMWYKINKQGGKALLYWSLPVFAIGIAAFLSPEIETSMKLIFGYAPLLYVGAAIQSYLFARKL